MSRVPLSNRKFQKKTSDRLHQPQHVQGRTNTMQRKVFTKPSRTPAADRYKIVNVKCQVPSPTTVGRRDVKRDLEQKNKRAKEQTPSTRDRHSAKRMREIYVNPNKDKPSHKPKSASKEIQRTKVQNEEATVKEKGETKIGDEDKEIQACEIVSEAHKMIWFWLFNGLFPTTNVIGE
ncbi:uncharacterized protein [Tenebrio molitor]|uniref:uncharacterized protein n=1 Tax=Tenebrio molitor TaxID=7067 RepID=UPI0036246C8B